MALIFNEESFLTNNIFQFEQRLASKASKYTEGNMVLTTYYHLHENDVTVDRGLQDIDQLFGKMSPLRFNKIINLPLGGIQQAAPLNTDESQVEDVNIESECHIFPSTIVPHPNDFFIVHHLRMTSIFQVIEVIYDSMKQEGYYRIRYRLNSTSKERMEKLEKQVVNTYRCELDAIGTDTNPIIQIDDAIRRTQIMSITHNMIEDYKAMFYNSRHNCFLFPSKRQGRWFDLCANEFIAKHSLMNVEYSPVVLMIHRKLNEARLAIYYQQSVYRWLEDHAPLSRLNKFPFLLKEAFHYRDSSFYRWSEFDVNIIFPVLQLAKEIDQTSDFNLFNHEQLLFLREEPARLGNNVYENLIKQYIHGQLDSVNQVPLTIGNALADGLSDSDNFFLTPVIIYIIREVLQYS